MRSACDFAARSHAHLGEQASLERTAELGFDAVAIDVDHDLDALLAAASPDFTAAATTPDTPALLFYTSGTTGHRKGALHGHRVLAGHLPGFELSHDFFPQPGDRIWTPADWAWIGGLYDVVMPGLAHRVPVVAFRTQRFDPEAAFDVISHAGIRNVFMPATALRMMRRSNGCRWRCGRLRAAARRSARRRQRGAGGGSACD